MKHEKSKNDAMRHELDHIDAKILNLLRENARMPLKEIAEHVFLSSPAVSARIERLEKEGYITGYQVKLNPALLGYPIKAFINLEVEPVQKKEFYPYTEKVRNVVECNCVTGDYSMLIEGLFVSTIELDQFIGELQHFGRTRTQIVFSTSVEHRQVTAHAAGAYAPVRSGGFVYRKKCFAGECFCVIVIEYTEHFAPFSGQCSKRKDSREA